MCIICVLQKVSHRARTLLPWLVMALVALWAVSQLLPSPFRLEMTPARLACGLFLVVIIFWYRILMPQLSFWRAQRSARLREQRLTQAIELQMLRKVATRRCRNCLTPYRDQNPGGGKFMCSYCGHISKRPVLDIPGTPGSSGIVGDLVGKNGWICHQDWSTNGNRNRVGSAPRYWLGGGDEQCLTEKPYSGAAILICRLISSFFFSMRWLCMKVFGVGSSSEDGSSDADCRGSSKKGNSDCNYQESRSEKARRKAEEKRQARLEKEMLEEEEKKQREEVARLIEERRKLRDEQAEKENSRNVHLEKIRDSKKEAEKKRQERRKDKDKGSSKSNSDGEEVDRRVNRESERKHEHDKKSDSDRHDVQKGTSENSRMHISETTQGVKNIASKPRYFDRVRGSFLSSSRGFGGTNFFAKGAKNPVASVTKPSRPSTVSVEQTVYANRKESHASANIIGKNASSIDDEIAVRRHVTLNQPQTNAWKKSLHQLFTRSPTVSPSPDVHVISSPSQGNQTVQIKDQEVSSVHMSQNQIHAGQPLSLNPYPGMSDTVSNNVLSSFTHLHTVNGEPGHNLFPEEAEHFEDPCYIPDPAALLGPISESLDNFSIDLGSELREHNRLESSPFLRSMSNHNDGNRLSPIESPLSRLRMNEEKPSQFSNSLWSGDSKTTACDESNATEKGTWKMWGSPLGQDSLGIGGGPASWLLPVAHSKVNQEDVRRPLPQNHITTYLPEDIHPYSAAVSSVIDYIGSPQNGGMYSPLGTALCNQDPWLQHKSFQHPPSDTEGHLPALNLEEKMDLTEMAYNSPSKVAAGHPFGLSSDCWPNLDMVMSGRSEEVRSVATSRPPIGGLFPASPDVQSVWSFK